jgi:hypothetical protein
LLAEKERHDAVGSQEVLLIDEGDEYLWHEECPNPIQVIKGGSEDAFQQGKGQLLSPELGPKETCLRPSGISTMIFALHNPNDDPVARRFTVIEISRRVREVLGGLPRYESVETNPEIKTVRRVGRQRWITAESDVPILKQGTKTCLG